MANFFSLISFGNLDRDQFYADNQKFENALSIGWGKINPINRTYEEIEISVKLNYSQLETLSITNAAKSLHRFKNLELGDIVFVRGEAKILDAVIISSIPYFDTIGHEIDDYFLKIKFTPLFASINCSLNLNELQDEAVRKEFIFSEGRSVALKNLDEKIAIEILKMLIN